MQVRKIDYGGRTRWELDAGRIEGKRRRFFFSTERAASAKLRQLQAERDQIGKQWAHLASTERRQTLEVLAQISAAGFTLRQVWEGFKKAKTAVPVRETALGKAIGELVDAKKAANRRERYLEELRRYLNQFARGREELPVGAIRLDDLLAWFTSREEAPATKASNIGKLSALFDFCVRKGYTDENPCRRLEKVHVEVGIPKIFSVGQCRALMEAAEAVDLGLTAELALGLFAGLRPAEIERISWNLVNLERKFLTVDAAAAKKRHRRLVPLNETCIAWLKLNGEIPVAKNRRRRFARICQTAGITDWPHDVLRHTAASHLLVKHGARFASEMLGHSETMLYRHYRELVSPEDNQDFWTILPKSPVPTPTPPPKPQS